ncbi:TIR domain-containing protein [Chondrus crispus]|uniref:TIR domain-containing protein n=1 Tax=Chondrus crispus TaxID=2769 RepID=R7QEX7_CHOCR|nr:TIR domain-containing protein [Chondrus crispus]CDF36338.1 TIR domain-containing protein [Chondrus crispus]|eukprot:XP_005716157.1 TIR domain-containing protein [Chondrus crispus]
MNLNTLLDASMAFDAILNRLHSAISFGDSILAHRVTRHQNSKLTKLLTELIAVYRSHNLKHRILNLKRDLVKQDPAFFSSADKSQLETLMRHDALNFSKPANVLHILLNTLNSNKSQEEKSAELKTVLQRVDGFRDAAERARAIVDKLKNIAGKYITKENHHGCRPSTKGEVESFRKKYIRVFGTVHVPDKLEASKPRKETTLERKDNCSGDNCVPQKSTKDKRSNPSANHKKSCLPEPKRDPKATPEACDDKKTHCHTKPGEKNVAKGTRVKAKPEFTVFISFCDLDKNTIAIPLHARLTKKGISSFCGKQSLIPGEDVREARNRALRSAAIFVFILSPEFAFRETNQEDLSYALKRSKYAKKSKTAGPILLPVYHRMTTEEANKELFDLQAPRNQYSTNSHRSASAASIVTVCRKEGFQERVERGEAKFADVRKLFEELDGIADVGPGMNSSNAKHPEATKNREEVLSLTEKAVKSAMHRLNNQ